MPPVRRQISPHAIQLRRDMTDVEATVWLALRNRRLEGFKFRRQATIGPYVVDFLCIETMLIIELDGVLETIRAALLKETERRRPSPNPLPQAGEG